MTNLKMKLFLWDNRHNEENFKLLGINPKFVSNAYTDATVYEYRYANVVKRRFPQVSFWTHHLIPNELREDIKYNSYSMHHLQSVYGSVYSFTFEDLRKFARFEGCSFLNQGISYNEDPCILRKIKVKMWKEGESNEQVKEVLCFIANTNNRYVKERMNLRHRIRGQRISMSNNFMIKGEPRNELE